MEFCAENRSAGNRRTRGGRGEGRSRGQAVRGVAFVHTEVSPEYEGRGVGAALARAALDEARTANLRVLATCPFIAGWIARHPEYQDLLYQSRSRVSD
ncbi:N-acetyltransferase [Micromonospora sp. NBC_01739]|nr:N-acetyltransferase [Micromonospora sp. NBC_01739]